jgi:hypothetical protein
MISKNCPEIKRPRQKDLLVFNEYDYLWEQEPFKKWFTEEILTNPLIDLFKNLCEANSWFPDSFRQYKINMRKIKDYDDFMESVNSERMAALEDHLVTGAIWDEVTKKIKVDKEGNTDLAPGWLNWAKYKTDHLRWVLERNTGGPALPKLGVVIMSGKDDDET